MVRFTQFQFRNAVTHFFQKMRYQPFKKGRGLLHDFTKQFIRQLCVQFFDRPRDQFIRRFIGNIRFDVL